ncbi:MAG: L-2-hydroxyglutarate oxidase [Chloroflexi bacterium]|nr:MAG: L-2-hydroxyglutarate oxidase [Chloroflexota bacterium]
MTEAHDADLAIVGAGLIGLATARQILRRRPGIKLVVLEKEAQIASHQSGHNSGVIHSGIYYAPGSLKARLCIGGAALLRVYCDEHGIAHPETGKLIVAVRKSELGRLDALKQRGEANGLRGLQMVDGDGIRQFEPAARGLRAIFSPATGIVDYGQVADALAKDVTAGGGSILTSHRVTGLTRSHGRWRITAATSTVDARTVISCAGLQSDTLAAMTGAALDPRIVPFRGEYARLSGERAGMVRGLIYPVPDPAFPFLGVHFTRRVGGEVWVGPNAILALAKEGYRRTRINAAELASLLRWPGFYRMGARYWRMGLSELSLALNKGAFARELQRYVPAVQAKDLSPAGAGVRAQAVSRDGRLLDDFVFSEEEGILHVRNAPSPAATACLAIAEVIADRVDR